MLQKFLSQFTKELELGEVNLAAGVPGSYALPIDEGITIAMTEIPHGFTLECTIAPFPQEKVDAFATSALLANLFNQGTQGATLGIGGEKENLTLTRVIDYPIDYKEFKGIIEDFINTIDFWKDEVIHHK